MMRFSNRRSICVALLRCYIFLVTIAISKSFLISNTRPLSLRIGDSKEVARVFLSVADNPNTFENTLIDPSNIHADVIYDALSALLSANNPLYSILGSYLLVTASDMVPFVPCQPLAIALGAKLGFPLAFPITSAGQTTAGVLAFTLARRAVDKEKIRDYAAKLEPEALAKFEEFQRLSAGGTKQDDRNVLLALIGLRLAPFFPFSAGNYLLGSATAVPLSLFTLATLFGCLLSNFISTSIGAGGAAAVLHLSS